MAVPSRWTLPCSIFPGIERSIRAKKHLTEAQHRPPSNSYSDPHRAPCHSRDESCYAWSHADAAGVERSSDTASTPANIASLTDIARHALSKTATQTSTASHHPSASPSVAATCSARHTNAHRKCAATRIRAVYAGVPRSGAKGVQPGAPEAACHPSGSSRRHGGSRRRDRAPARSGAPTRRSPSGGQRPPAPTQSHLRVRREPALR